MGTETILKLDLWPKVAYDCDMIHKLEFDELSHTYRLNGIPVPSVTTILKPLSGLDKVPRPILEKAAAYGTAVHYATELYDRAELDEVSLPDEFRNAIEAYKGFLFEHSPEWLAIECRTFHPALMYAGTVDRVCKIDGKTYVLDLKTTFKLNPAVSAQLAAYAKTPLIAEYGIDGILSLKLPKSDEPPTYTLETHDMAEGWTTFLSCLQLRNFCMKHNLKGTPFHD